MEERLVDRDIAAYENPNIIEEAILGRANGLFLYAKLSMDVFLEPGADTCEVLKNLPADLSVMYDDLLRNHAKRSGVPNDLQLLVLQAVTHATRPLRLLEITEMVSAVYDGLQFHGICTPSKTKEWVRATCGPLLEILPDETVSVVHHSLTEFLKGFTRSSEANESSYPVFRPNPTNKSLAVSCLKYLRHGCLDKHEVKKQSDFDNIWGGWDDDWEAMERAKAVKQAKADLRLRFPFQEYAANNWPEHARRASNAGADITYF
ncbi:hypothetical protein N7520_000467 [Penicillium odoratum]|uniref:uncharacterized protein n=1 Tax=Penicillium odoratum TaxID=1167516 RepID=UPI002548EE19|nr:uncharacterized protein N7520_000467 [Penicillium odoratum]KAJ5777221.1 hypothetical protein N7520_000467 [Penicillium odoratum]